jgi:hypothetical protein
MKNSHLILVSLAVLSTSSTQLAEEREISLTNLRDKIEGG